jgi:hypothetical protein
MRALRRCLPSTCLDHARYGTLLSFGVISKVAGKSAARVSILRGAVGTASLIHLGGRVPVQSSALHCTSDLNFHKHAHAHTHTQEGGREGGTLREPRSTRTERSMRLGQVDRVRQHLIEEERHRRVHFRLLLASDTTIHR